MKSRTEKFILKKTKLFETISLGEMDKVKLMNRTDTKYWFHAEHLLSVLEAVQDSYFMLSINNEVAMAYSTLYYDTNENSMFIAHHNGKLNRYKIRRRSYMSSGISFLEVKFKNNKGRTIKTRIPTNFEVDSFNDAENSFVSNNSPFSVDDLKLTLINNFSRITLVNKNFNERCTIDFNLNFTKGNNRTSLNNLVIVEIKADGPPSSSPLDKALRSERIKTSGFSKYCIGRTVTDSTIKSNAFKNKIRMIQKTIYGAAS